MTKLSLGVEDLPYADDGKTTGDVAEILETKYGVMETFAELHGQEIADDLAAAAAGALGDLLVGAPVSHPFAEAEGKIAKRFRDCLNARELDGKIVGVPTAASLAGVNHRLKRPYRKSNPVRPSFIDTGLYQASMRAKVSS